MNSAKRKAGLSHDEVQRGNKDWWTSNPMTYDWHGEISATRYSREWFEAIDSAHISGARLFAHGSRLFERVIPLDRLADKKVLEIGCGMGLHTATMVQAGAQVTAIDLTPTAVEATKKRLELGGLQATVLQADAEDLPFGAGAFDFVWSWGVIHHSGSTARVVREIARVLRPDGECRIMVYNRLGAAAALTVVRDHILRGGFLKQSMEETLYAGTDGFSARYYVPEQFEDLFRAFFKDVSSRICGQESDAVPFPRALRRLAIKVLPETYLRTAQSRRGGFIFLTATNPIA